jgi:hypothetical protein
MNAAHAKRATTNNGFVFLALLLFSAFICVRKFFPTVRGKKCFYTVATTRLETTLEEGKMLYSAML